MRWAPRPPGALALGANWARAPRAPWARGPKGPTGPGPQGPLGPRAQRGQLGPGPKVPLGLGPNGPTGPGPPRNRNRRNRNSNRNRRNRNRPTREPNRTEPNRAFPGKGGCPNRSYGRMVGRDCTSPPHPDTCVSSCTFPAWGFPVVAGNGVGCATCKIQHCR